MKGVELNMIGSKHGLNQTLVLMELVYIEWRIHVLYVQYSTYIPRMDGGRGGAGRSVLSKRE